MTSFNYTQYFLSLHVIMINITCDVWYTLYVIVLPYTKVLYIIDKYELHVINTYVLHVIVLFIITRFQLRMHFIMLASQSDYTFGNIYSRNK